MTTTITRLADSVAVATRRNGGTTVRLDGSAPTTGYAVAVRGHERVVSIDDDLPTEVARFIADKHALLTRRDDLYVGTWIDGDKVYLDVTQVVPDLWTARFIGTMRGELAVYDLAAGREIRLDQIAVA